MDVPMKDIDMEKSWGNFDKRSGGIPNLFMS